MMVSLFLYDVALSHLRALQRCYLDLRKVLIAIIGYLFCVALLSSYSVPYQAEQGKCIK